MALSRLSLRSGAAGVVRAMSSTAKVWIDENTKVICQGFTGKQVKISRGRWEVPGVWVGRSMQGCLPSPAPLANAGRGTSACLPPSSGGLFPPGPGSVMRGGVACEAGLRL